MVFIVKKSESQYVSINLSSKHFFKKERENEKRSLYTIKITTSGKFFKETIIIP